MTRARSMLGALPLTLVAVAVGSASCGQGVQADSGVGEPIQVSGAQFIQGDMPGTAPVDAGGQSPEGGPEAPLSVVEVGYQNTSVVPGASGKAFTALVTTDAVAVGVRLGDLGTGYWVVPVAGRDALVPNTTDVSFSASFDIGDSPGLQPLRLVALGYDGSGGEQLDTTVCVESRVPDNGHACDPNQVVPAIVISLRWDTNFDVDLHVITPDGTDVNPKTNPLAVPVDAGLPPANDPKLDRDSLGQCVPDGRRQEDLVFPDYPATGPYDIYADPFASCGQAAVRFEMTIYEAQSDGSLQATYSQAGELLANDTTGGGSSGLFVAEKVFN